MPGPSADRKIEWEGSSLGELVSALLAQALPVRIEVIAPGAGASIAGEVHLLAGGLSDAFAGSLRRDDAVAALQRLEGARFLVECRLPHPESGSIEKPGPNQGSLKERHLAALMRYCEDYVLSGKLEVRRGEERATIEYRRGEIASTVVGGVDGSDRLPEVMAWTEGSYEIVLPAPTLPPVATPRKREVPPAVRPVEGGPKVEPKRHSTLPMVATTAATAAVDPAPGATTQARTATAPAPAAPWRPTQPLANPRAQKPPVQVQASPHTPRTFAQPHAAATTQKPAVQPPLATPVQKPAALPQASPPTQKPPTQRLAGVLAKKTPVEPPAVPVAQRTPLARITPVPATPLPIAVAPGAPPAPAADRTVQSTAESAIATLAAVPPGSPMMAEETTRGTPPVPAVPLSPPVRHPPPVGRPAAPIPAGPAKPAGAQAKPRMPGPEPLAPLPPAQPAGATGKSSELPAQPARPTQVASQIASNDLKPKSGTIDARSLHANHLPPHAAPIELAESPMVDERPAEPTPPLGRFASPAAARARRRRRREHPMLTYVVVGLAVGMAAVLVYWAYLHLPLGHR
jgi:hypothetical protein